MGIYCVWLFWKQYGNLKIIQYAANFLRGSQWSGRSKFIILDSFSYHSLRNKLFLSCRFYFRNDDEVLRTYVSVSVKIVLKKMFLKVLQLLYNNSIAMMYHVVSRKIFILIKYIVVSKHNTSCIMFLFIYLHIYIL